MKKVKLVSTLLVIVTGVFSFSFSVFDNKPIQEPVKFYVDYRNSIEKFDTLGNYLVSKKEISSKMFKQEKITGTDTLNGVLISFPGLFSSKEILSWIQENKMRGATVKESQSFGIQNEIAFGSGVVALGSEIMYGGFKSVPVTINDKRGITIELYPSEGKWNGTFYKFLAVRI